MLGNWTLFPIGLKVQKTWHMVFSITWSLPTFLVSFPLCRLTSMILNSLCSKVLFIFPIPALPILILQVSTQSSLLSGCFAWSIPISTYYSCSERVDVIAWAPVAPHMLFTTRFTIPNYCLFSCLPLYIMNSMRTLNMILVYFYYYILSI